VRAISSNVGSWGPVRASSEQARVAQVVGDDDNETDGALRLPKTSESSVCLKAFRNQPSQPK
jgi:hypothetical protein